MSAVAVCDIVISVVFNILFCNWYLLAKRVILKKGNKTLLTTLVSLFM